MGCDSGFLEQVALISECWYLKDLDFLRVSINFVLVLVDCNCSRERERERERERK